MHDHELVGVRVRSEVELRAPRSSFDRPDLHVRLGPSRAPALGDGELVAELERGGRLVYRFVSRDGAVVGRLGDLCDVAYDAALAEAVVHPGPTFDPALLPVLVGGTVLSFALLASGSCVLHGSAVAVGGDALAVVGSSGTGKSTVTALLLAAGADFVTDDVLRLDVPDAGTGGGTQVVGGLSELRLRRKAASLVDRLSDRCSFVTTPDDRIGVVPPTSGRDRHRLAALVVPVPDREAQRVHAERLHGVEALEAVARNHRIEGWSRTEDLRRVFGWSAAIVRETPVWRVRIPWGPPFAEDLGHAVLDATLPTGGHG